MNTIPPIAKGSLAMKIDSLSLDGTEDEHPCDCVRRLLNNQKVCAIVLAFCGILNVLCSTLETIGVISPVLSPYVSTAMGLLCLPAIGACCLLTGRLLKFYRAHANIMSLADFFTMFLKCQPGSAMAKSVFEVPSFLRLAPGGHYRT